MAKAGKPRHSGTTRKPPVIDHEPVAPKVHDAEPVGFDDTPTEKTSTETIPPHINQARTPDMKQQDTAAPSKATQKPVAKSAKGSVFVAGFAGGLLALVVAGGLQWAGLLPSPQKGGDSTKTLILQQQIDALKAETSALVGVVKEGAKETGDAVSYELINQRAEEAAATVEKALNALEQNNRDISLLKTTLDGLAAQNGDPKALSALTQQLTALQDQLGKVEGVGTRLAETQGVVEQLRTRLDTIEDNITSLNVLANRVNAVEANTQKLRNDMAGFSKEVALLAERPVTPDNQDLPLFVAANALKAAVDRGSSFGPELETFAAIAPKNIDLGFLQAHAASGVPSVTELSQSFAKVADKIAATENAALDNAGIGQKLWSSARNLVTSRPIGNIAGTNPAAIAARMEVALQKGDVPRALNEWQALPQMAKDVSADFIKTLEARRDADVLINALVVNLLQPTEK